jgi:hypothetical protein
MNTILSIFYSIHSKILVVVLVHDKDYETEGSI